MTNFVVYRDPFGNKLTEIHAFNRLEYQRAENKPGWLYLDLDPKELDKSFLRVDARLEPWRAVGGNPAYLDGETVYFLTKWGYKYSGAAKYLHLECEDALGLLKRRRAAYRLTHAKDEITSAAADDSLKVIVSENMGADADDTARTLATYLTIEANKTLGATIYKQYAWRPILDVMGEICENSFQAGTYLCFDIVYTSPTMLEFRTYTGQRGINRGFSAGNNKLIFSSALRNIENVEEYEDHSDESNYIYATGPGQGAAQVVQTSTSTAAVGLSPFNRREMVVYAGGASGATAADTDALVLAEAKAGLYKYRSRRVYSGKLVEREGCLYGVHYRFGDIVYCQGDLQGYDAHIYSIHVTVTRDGETLEHHVKAEA